MIHAAPAPQNEGAPAAWCDDRRWMRRAIGSMARKGWTWSVADVVDGLHDRLAARRNAGAILPARRAPPKMAIAVSRRSE